MAKIVVMGECMMELSHISESHLAKSFAGDVYNTAVYAKRVNPDCEVSFLTAAGDDALSNELVSVLEAENISPEFVYKDAERTIGSYMVNVDEHGERSFTYWRSDSAAKQVMKLVDDDFVSQAASADYFFYSGISLAILAPEDREKLWGVLEALRAAGVKVVFDPNYRPKLWAKTANAIDFYNKAFSLCDLLLPGIEDFDWLYGINTVDGIQQLLQPFAISEVVLKNGPKKVTCFVAGEEVSEIEITPVDKVIDTTSAGDSFNGAFLASRLQGQDLASSIRFAAAVAGEVIQHKGAIVPLAKFSPFLEALRT